MNPYVVLGNDEEEVANKIIPGAVLDGTHDAIATLTKYAVVGGIVFGLGYVFLSEKMKKSLQEKYL